VSNDWNLYATPYDFDSYNNYKKLRSLLLTIVFDTSTVVGTVLAYVPVDPMRVPRVNSAGGAPIYYMTHLASMTMDYAWWRGGIEYLILIDANMYQSCRVRVVWVPDATDNSAIFPDQLADTLSKVIDVNGSTISTLRIPFLANVDYLRVAELNDINTVAWQVASNKETSNGHLRFYLETPLVASQNLENSVVYMSVFVRGSSSFEIHRQKATDTEHYPFEVNADNVDREAVRQMHRDNWKNFEDYETIVPAKERILLKTNFGDHVGSHTDMLHRFTYLGTVDLAGGEWVVINPYVGGGNLKSTAYNRTRSKFLASRGGTRITLIPKGIQHANLVTIVEVANYIDGASFVDEGGDGHFFFNVRDGSAVQFTIPYQQGDAFTMLDPIPVQENRYRMLARVRSNVTGDGETCSFGIWISPADDSSTGWPISPLALTYIANPQNKLEGKQVKYFPGGSRPDQTDIFILNDNAKKQSSIRRSIVSEN
jgi:hypothetical protein